MMKLASSKSLFAVLAALVFFAAAPPAHAQLFGQPGGGGDDVSTRIGRLEAQLRSMTGQIEELQYKNQQLEQQLKRALQDTEFRLQEMNPGNRPPAGAPRGQQGGPPQQGGLPPLAPPVAQQRPLPPVASAPQALPPLDDDLPPQRGRRDVFDPNASPNAPGAPRPLGSLPGGRNDGPGPVIMSPGNEPPVRRPPGAPMDLGNTRGSDIQSGPPQQGPRGIPPQGPVGRQAVLAPSGSAKDEFDLAVGAMQRRDYELADESFRTFLANHPDDRMVPDAYYWLGESQYQRKLYNDSAETFLENYNKYPDSTKAPDGLLRLGQSLAALGKKEAACASLGAVITKYPKASANVKKAVEQEQKRARC